MRAISYFRSSVDAGKRPGNYCRYQNSDESINVDKAIIGIENNKPDAINHLLNLQKIIKVLMSP